MPSRAEIIATSVELTLVLIGLVVLWQAVLSPAARARNAGRPSPLAPWEALWSDFFLFLWTIVCGGILGQFLAVLLFKPLGLGEDGKLLLVNAAFESGMLCGIAVYRFGLRPEEKLLSFAPLRTGLSGLVTFLIAMPIVLLISLVWQYLLKVCGLPIEQQDMIDWFAKGKDPALVAAMIVLPTVTAPIAEELIFRAGFFRYFRTRMPRWAALLLPACLFAALHQNLATFAPLAALGIVFSLAYERTGRIGTSMVAHGLFNAHTVALIFIDPSAAS